MAGVLLDAHWRKLARLIGRPELGLHPDYATTEARLRRRREVDALLGAWAGQRSVAAFVESFAELGIPAAPVRTYAEAAADPHVEARDMLQPATAAAGSAPLVGPAAKLSRTPTRVRSSAPELGQHNEQILAELGYDRAAIERLERAGAHDRPVR
jgi:formyl-CoA transferase